MSRTLHTMGIVICCLAVLSVTHTAAAADRGVYIAIARGVDATRPAARAKSPTIQVLVSPDRRVFVAVRISVRKGETIADATLKALRARHNNVHAMAVNTTGVARATTTVTQGNRVFLRAAPTAGGSSEVMVAEGTDSK